MSCKVEEYLTESFWILNLVYSVNYLAIDDNWRWLLFMNEDSVYPPIDINKTEEQIEKHLKDLDKLARMSYQLESKSKSNKEAENEFVELYNKIVRRLLLDNGVDFKSLFKERDYGDVHDYVDFKKKRRELLTEIGQEHIDRLLLDLVGEEEETKGKKIVELKRKK